MEALSRPKFGVTLQKLIPMSELTKNENIFYDEISELLKQARNAVYKAGQFSFSLFRIIRYLLRSEFNKTESFGRCTTVIKS